MYPSNKLNGGEPLFSGDYGECYCPHCGADDAAIGDCGDTAATAWNYQQGRIDALVEALEKAQAAERRWHRVASRIHEQACESDVKIDELEAIRAAAEKLVRCKGRYHSEQNYRALAALFGVNTPDLPPLEHENVHYADAAEMEIEALRQRIAELESRAVTVGNLQESAFRAGLTAGWNLGLANNNDGFNKCLAAHAAGIKVKAE
ncbi:ead/Ea22-like family protein [Raoultella ornithinolytica]|nr:ead/Ea22-like family protein [Raoultella ornithinolytica]